MSQTSNERLRDYLAQLPPQSQALLMREFERAIERGEDATVATFVLEQLRKIVRGTDEEEARPRTDDPARLVFRPLEPFLVEGNFPRAAGADPPRVAAAGVAMADPRRRAGAGARIRGGAGANARNRRSRRSRSRGPPNFQHAAADAIGKVATPASGDDRRALARVGPPEVIEDMLPIGSVLQAREAMDTLNGRLPQVIPGFRGFADRIGRRRAQRSHPCKRRNCCRSRCRW